MRSLHGIIKEYDRFGNRVGSRGGWKWSRTRGIWTDMIQPNSIIVKVDFAGHLHQISSWYSCPSSTDVSESMVLPEDDLAMSDLESVRSHHCL